MAIERTYTDQEVALILRRAMERQEDGTETDRAPRAAPRALKDAEVCPGPRLTRRGRAACTLGWH